MIAQDGLTVHLVRHGHSQQERRRPAEEWQLSEIGKASVLELKHSAAIPDLALWYSSPEPKAATTARLLTDSPVELVDELREAHRTAVWFDDQAGFEAAVRRSFADPEIEAIPGWEPLAVTRARMSHVVGSIVGCCARSDLVLVGHGTAWTILVSELTDSAPDLAGWTSMSMPDHCAIDLGTRSVVSGWGDWSRNE